MTDQISKFLHLTDIMLKFEQNDIRQRLDALHGEGGQWIEHQHKRIENTSNQEKEPPFVEQILNNYCSMKNDLVLEQLCECEQSNKKQIFEKIFDQLPKKKDLASNGWLSNENVDNIFTFFKSLLKGFHYLETTTSDFLRCNFKKIGDLQSLNVKYTEEWRENDMNSCNISDVEKNIQFFDQFQDAGVQDYKLLNQKTLQDMINDGVLFICGVVNTSICKENGQHWVCFLINIKEQTLELFDSTIYSAGNKLCTFKNYLKNLTIMFAGLKTKEGNSIEMRYNEYSSDIQKTDSTCGIYCILFIIARVLGINFDKFQSVLRDSSINDQDQLLYKFRDKLFR